jgi:hypothetical protein
MQLIKRLLLYGLNGKRQHYLKAFGIIIAPVKFTQVDHATPHAPTLVVSSSHRLFLCTRKLTSSLALQIHYRK